MIKSINIKNFESHEDTIVEFSNGMNLIWGKSDSGKSSIIRAIAMVVNNQFDKDMVRNGCKFCEVTIETDKGKVTCQRGDGVNKWIITESNGEHHSFEKIGKNVPEIANKVLGMKEKKWGKNLSELPNFMFQNEKHYMLSEIGGEKSTSNMIARLMDRTIGLGGLEELIKEISSNILRKRKELSDYTSEISSLKSGLTNEEMIKEKEDNINEIKKTYLELKICEDMFLNIKNYIIKKNEYDYKINKNNNSIDKKNEIICFDTELINLLSKKIELLKLKSIIDKIKRNEIIIEKLNDVETLEKERENIKDTIENYWQLFELNQKINILREKIKTNVEKKEKINNRLSKLNEEESSLKDKLKICPVCGNFFKKGDNNE